jgi:hypothetical protein
MWSNDDNATLDGGGVPTIGEDTIGHGGTGGDVSGDLECKETFASAVIAIEEGEAREGKAVLPEPANGLGAG